MADARKKRGESYCVAFGRVMNNFHMHFPIGNIPNDATESAMTPQGFYRAFSLERCWNITRRLLLSQDPSSSDNDKAKYSDKRLDQTAEQFYEEIDKTVQEVGIPMKKISEVVNRRMFGESGEVLYKDMWEVLLPVYRALRKKGYSHGDLVS